MIFIDQTIVSIAAPSIIGELGLSSSGMQWVVNAYLLALAAFLAVALALAFLCALRHPGTRVTDEPASAGTAAGPSRPGR